MPSDAAPRGAGVLMAIGGAEDRLGDRTILSHFDELEATKLALDRANPGDLVVLCADQVDAIVDELQSRVRS
jgi:hypothetical protein